MVFKIEGAIQDIPPDNGLRRLGSGDFAFDENYVAARDHFCNCLAIIGPHNACRQPDENSKSDNASDLGVVRHR